MLEGCGAQIFEMEVIVGFFFIFSVLTFLAVLLIYNVEQTTWVRKKTQWVKLQIKGKVIVKSTRGFIVGCVLASVVVFSLIIGVFLFVVLYQLRIETSVYFSPIELISSAPFGDGAIGIIFGGVLGAFSIFIYHLPAGTSLTYFHKFLGVALLLFFMIGATSITLEEVLRSFSYGENGVAFQLSSDNIGGENSALNNIRAVYPNVKSPGSESGQTGKVGEAGLSGGFNTLRFLPYLIDADVRYFEQYGKMESPSGVERTPAQEKISETLKQKRADKLQILSDIAKSYRENIFELFSCLAGIVKETGDIKYVNENLATLKPAIRVLYVKSRREPEKNSVDNPAALAVMEKFRKKVTLDLAKVRDEIVNHGDALKSGLCANVPAVVSVPKVRPGIKKRPYLALFYASLLNIDGQELEAIAVLEDFLKNLEKSESPKRMAFWYEQRARGTLNGLYESYVEKNQARTPLVVLSSYLSSLDAYINLINQLEVVKESQVKFFPLYNFQKVTGRRLSTLRFYQDPGFAFKCKNPGGSKNSKEAFNDILMNSALISTQAVFAWRSLEHPKFNSIYVKHVADITERIANTDLSCMRGVYGKNKTREQRAEFLNVYAMFQLKLINLRKNYGKGYQDWATNKAILALEASKLARQVLIPVLEENKELEKSSNATGGWYLAKLANSQATELDGRLQRIINHVEQKLSRN